VSIRWIRAVLAALTALTVAGSAGCGSSPNTGSSSSASRTSPGLTGPVMVFAASSLTEAFTTIGKKFETANPGTKVTFNFLGSTALATQINQGAPADVFASASPTTMKTVTDAGNGDGTPTTFAKNQLVIAVPHGNTRAIRTLADLARPGIKVALCAEQVPCGAAAKKALDGAGVKLTPVTFEQDVKGSLSKVKLGEVDAALVYRTDARAASPDVDGIEFAESAGAMNEYPIVALKNAPNEAGARAFLTYVLSGEARTVLIQAGFQAP
jgi:molybdate transport system substrate-binding protein